MGGGVGARWNCAQDSWSGRGGGALPGHWAATRQRRLISSRPSLGPERRWAGCAPGKSRVPHLEDCHVEN